MKMKDKVKSILAEALLASVATTETDVQISASGEQAAIAGLLNLDVLASRIARLAGIEDIAMIPMFNMATWNGDRDATPEAYIPLAFPSQPITEPEPTRPGQATLKLVARPSAEAPEPARPKPRLVHDSDHPTPAA